jgi:hypothetical protein
MQRADYEQALEAGRRWIAEQGRYPQQQEWEHQAPGRPTTRTIKRRWGWEELMRAAAGAGARSQRLETRRQHRLELLLTLRRACEELGRWPTGRRVGGLDQRARLPTLLRQAVRELARRPPNGGSA